MENETSRLAEKAQELGDVELAVLLCLITSEHCIIEAEAQDVQSAEKELRQICHSTFGLQSTVIQCNEHTSPDDFGEGILIDDDAPIITPIATRYMSEEPFFSSVHGKQNGGKSPDRESGKRIADVVIAKELNLACSQVQIQALELIRSKRIFTRRAVFTTPKPFLLIGLTTSGKGGRLVPHLNDHISISHFYMSEEDEDKLYAQSNSSTGSVLRPTSQPTTPGYARRASYMSFSRPLITKDDIDVWSQLAPKARMSADVRAYLHNIVAFMRMHRAVAAGISAHATRHLYALSEALAPIHGLEFITPSLVALAARKIYPHRLTIVKPEDDLSLQWGSSLEAVRQYLEGMTAEDVIEDILEQVETPL